MPGSASCRAAGSWPRPAPRPDDPAARRVRGEVRPERHDARGQVAGARPVSHAFTAPIVPIHWLRTCTGRPGAGTRCCRPRRGTGLPPRCRRRTAGCRGRVVLDPGGALDVPATGALEVVGLRLRPDARGVLDGVVRRLRQRPYLADPSARRTAGELASRRGNRSRVPVAVPGWSGLPTKNLP